MLVEDIRTRLNARGERLTRPRQAILAVLADDDGHLSAEQILTAVLRRDPSVHRTTVYRNLEALIALGVVQHVHLSHTGAVYHLVAEGGEHLHLQCTSCHAITDAPASVMGGLVAAVERTEGFALNLGHVALTGTCRSCQHEGMLGT